MKTYLSIDLDYFVDSEQCLKYIKKILKMFNPICVVYHDELLHDINGSDCDSLINVDFHSDLADNGPDLILNEGTWANYVSFKNNGTFTWVYPSINCYMVKRYGQTYEGDGRCDIKNNPFTRNCFDVCGWKKTRRLYQKFPTDKQLNNVEKVGISLSPDWINNDIFDNVFPFLLERGIISNSQFRQVKHKRAELRKKHQID